MEITKELISLKYKPDTYLDMIATKNDKYQFLGNAVQYTYTKNISVLEMIIADKYPGRGKDSIKILDWGCGKCHISYMLKSKGYHVVSADLLSDSDDSNFSDNCLISSDQGINVEKLIDTVKLPFNDSEFDVVLSFGVLEHVSDDQSSLAEVFRVLKRGGIFYICFLPYKYSWTQRLAQLRGNYYHDRLYTIKIIKQLCSQAGFSEISAWHGQFLPKNSVPKSIFVEVIDRLITEFTPFKYIATNIECYAIK